MPRRELVIDDERLARVELSALLAARPEVLVVGEAHDLASSRAAITEHGPDLIFLDIQLGAESAFDLLAGVDATFDVIFVTAYDEHAVRAFEVSAFDYLLKPVHPERLAATLRRLESGGPRPVPEQPITRMKAAERLFVRTQDRWRFLQIAAITAIESRGDYSRVHTRDGETILLHKPLREWETTLPEHLFVRIHRSTILNLDCIDRVEEWSGQTFHVYLKGHTDPYQMSRRYASRLKH
jgi:two-component system LytT family response regulator